MKQQRQRQELTVSRKFKGNSGRKGELKGRLTGRKLRNVYWG